MGAHLGRYGANNTDELSLMRRIFIQYLTMGASLALMFSSVAYLRGAADTSYTVQMATLLLLIGWCSPFEASIGSLIFKNLKSASIEERVAISRRDLLILYRVLVVGCSFGVAFALYSNGDSKHLIVNSILIGIFFTIRLVEYACRINLVLLGLGLWGQIAINSFTALKWLISLSVFIVGYKEFIYLLLGHIAVGIISFTFLIRKRLQLVTEISMEATSTISEMRVRDDLLSITGVGLGVLSFQLDKLASGIRLVPADFAQYVFLCTLVFVGPYLLSPVFTLFQQNLAKISLREKASNDSGASVIRLSSLIVVAFWMPLLAVINFAWPVNISYIIYSQMGIILLASYLNCLAHISYLRFQVGGRFRMIFFQNLASATAAFVTLILLSFFNNDLYSLVLLAAALGQYAFGVVVEAIEKREWRVWPSFAGLVIIVPYLMLDLWSKAINIYIIFATLTSLVSILLVGFIIEARTLRVSSKRYYRIVNNFVSSAR